MTQQHRCEISKMKDKPTEEEIADCVASQSQSGKLLDIFELLDSDYSQTEYLILIECPLSDCDYQVENWHKTGTGISDHLLHEHRPEDFGLTPLSDAADQDPDEVAVRYNGYEAFHLHRCSGLSRADQSKIHLVDFDELDSGYSCCRRCKGRPVDLSFARE